MRAPDAAAPDPRRSPALPTLLSAAGADRRRRRPCRSLAGLGESFAMIGPIWVGSSTGAWLGPRTQPSAIGQHLAAGLDHPAGDAGGLLRGQPGDHRGDPARRPRLALRVGLRRRPEALGHAGERHRGDGVDRDVVAGHLQRDDVGERGDAGLGRAVVRLAGLAVDAADRRGVDDPPGDGLARLALLAPVRRPSGSGRTCP